MRPVTAWPGRARLCAAALLAAVLPAALGACGGGPAAPAASPTPAQSAAPTATPSQTAAPTQSATPAAAPTARPQPTPTPLPPGTFLATIAVTPSAQIRSGPGTDQAVVGQEPAGATDLFNGWYRRGDDPPVPDYKSGALETWSQDWYRLADGRGWVHSSNVKGFQPSGMAPVRWTAPAPRNVPIPPAGRHRIVISLLRQHLWAFDGSQLAYDTVIGTGRPELPTLLGTYHVFYKTSPYRMVSDWPYGSPYWYAPAWVDYVMEFISGGYFIHDAPWRSRWGPGANLAAGSHGCVNVPMPIMAQLYRWTNLGDEVVVQYT